MGGAARGSFTTGPIIGWPHWLTIFWLPYNIKRWLGNWFKWMWLQGNRCTAVNYTWYTFIGTGPLIWWILPNIIILDFQVCIAFWIVMGKGGGGNKWGRVWCRSIWLQHLVTLNDLSGISMECFKFWSNCFGTSEMVIPFVIATGLGNSKSEPLSKIQPLVKYGIKTVRSGCLKFAFVWLCCLSWLIFLNLERIQSPLNWWLTLST